MDFYFKKNHYNDMYLFSRPRPEEYGTMPLVDKNLKSWENALGDYEQCKSYILDYKVYAMSKSDPER